MPDQTDILTVDAIGDPESITVVSTCRRIYLIPQSPVQYNVHKPLRTSMGVPWEGQLVLECPAGTYRPGDQPVHLSVASGTLDFVKVEV